MFAAREYRIQECENVRDLLRNTLRYAYSSDSSKSVYIECLARLRLIEDAFGILEDDEEDELQELSNQLSELSELIGRVERSRIEEFSWPFALALQNLAVKICADHKDPTSPPPLFFISADDELTSYRIITEQGKAGLISSPLFSIIFPRSLKNFVLLHPILGHELGHAAISAPQHTLLLEQNVLRPLVAKSPLNDLIRFKKWLDRVNSNLDLDLRTEASLSWPEELYCDLFGLLLMGPSYVGATNSLLRPFKTRSISESHPPSATRFWVIAHAVNQLGWREFYAKHKKLKQPANKYFDSLTNFANQVPRKFRLLNTSQIEIALNELQLFLQTVPSALFEAPDPELVATMVSRLLTTCPPVASEVSSKLTIRNRIVDFRSILFAGWLTWMSTDAKNPVPTFINLNRLCQRGILQQSAVDKWSAFKEKNNDVRP
jgi:hypothetical protein